MSRDDPVQQWCGAAAQALADTADRAARLAVGLSTDWLDDHGRGWSERLTALRRELVDAAQQADALAARLRDPEPAGPTLAAAIAAALHPSGVAHDRGPLLGETSGARVGDGRGVQIPELPDPPSP